MKKLLIYLANEKAIVIMGMIIGLLVTLSYAVTPWIHLPTNNQYYGFIYVPVGMSLVVVFDKIYKLYCAMIRKEKYNVLLLLIVIIMIIILMMAAILVIDGGMLLRLGADWNLD